MESVVQPYLGERRTEPERLTDKEKEERHKEIQEQIRRRDLDNTPTWLKVIDDLAGGDRLKWDAYFDMSVVELLNAYSFNLSRNRTRSETLKQTASMGFEAHISAILTDMLFNK